MKHERSFDDFLKAQRNILRWLKIIWISIFFTGLLNLLGVFLTAFSRVFLDSLLLLAYNPPSNDLYFQVAFNDAILIIVLCGSPAFAQILLALIIRNRINKVRLSHNILMVLGCLVIILSLPWTILPYTLFGGLFGSFGRLMGIMAGVNLFFGGASVIGNAYLLKKKQTDD